MTRLRRTIAKRLKEAQNTAAMLTTFNEVDMTNVMALRERTQGGFREEARRAAGLHVVLRQGLHRRPEGAAGGQRRDRGRRPRLQELLRHRRRRRHAATAWSCRCCATPTRSTSPSIEKGIGDLGRKARDGKLVDRRPDRRHLHDLQRRRLRLADVDADPQPAAVGHPRHAQDPAAADGRRRRDQGAADDVPRAVTTTTASSTAARPCCSWCGSRNASRIPSACCSGFRTHDVASHRCHPERSEGPLSGAAKGPSLRSG